MAGIPFWNDFGPTGNDKAFLRPPGAWDILFVGSGNSQAQMPGIVKVIVHKKEQRVDKKHSPGSDGDTPTFLGWMPAKFDIRVTIWTPDQLNRFQQLLPTLTPFKSVALPKKLPALPQLQPLDANSVLTFQPDPNFDSKLAAYNKAANAPPTYKRVYQPVDISHPALALINVKAAYVYGITPFEPESEAERDVRFCVLKCWEFDASKQRAIQTPRGATGSLQGIPKAIQIQTPPESDPTTDPSTTQAVPNPATTGGASGSF